IVVSGFSRTSPCRDREFEVFLQLRARAHHGVAPAEDAARRVVPYGVAAEHQVAVPERVHLLREHAVAAARRFQRVEVRQEPASGPLRLVPPVLDARIGQRGAGPLRHVVARIHVEPDHQNVRVGLLMFPEQLLLRPPGAGDAGRSRRRQEQDQARTSCVGVEPGFDFLNAAQRREAHCGGRDVLQRDQCERKHGGSETKAFHVYLPRPMSGQYRGTSSSRITAVTIDRTAPTFSMSLLSKYPYEYPTTRTADSYMNSFGPAPKVQIIPSVSG